MVTASFELHREDELRIVVSPQSHAHLRLLDGSAEIFGYDLPLARWITFPPAHKFAVFTWSGATIEIDGYTDVACVENETPMASYRNVHLMLEKKYAEGVLGPRVIVAGPTDSGKSTISKTLIGWAIRQNRKPMFVDLDIGQNSITIPGAIAGTVVNEPVDPVEGIPLADHFLYFYGHANPSANSHLYKYLIKDLAVQLNENTETRAYGMVINTMGWVEGLGYDLLLHAVKTFNVDVVLVMGERMLHSKLCNDLRARPETEIFYLEKSKGVVPRSREYRRCARDLKMKEYFHSLSGQISPPSYSVHFDEVRVFTITYSKGSKEVGVKKFHAVPVSLEQGCINSVLAVSRARQPSEVVLSPVSGFIYVTDIDLRRKRMTYITPSLPGPLPSTLLIKGSLFWTQ